MQKDSKVRGDVGKIFEQTTVDVEDVNAYLLNPKLTYVQHAIAYFPNDKRTIGIAKETEVFDSLFRSHLGGVVGAHAQLFHQVRRIFELYGEVGEWVTFVVLHNVQCAITRNEWYELQSRYDAVASQLKNHVGLWVEIIKDRNYVKSSH